MYFGYPSSLREGGGSFQALDKARDLTSMVTIYRHIVSNNVENLTVSNHKLSCALRVRYSSFRGDRGCRAGFFEEAKSERISATRCMPGQEHRGRVVASIGCLQCGLGMGFGVYAGHALSAPPQNLHSSTQFHEARLCCSLPFFHLKTRPLNPNSSLSAYSRLDLNLTFDSDVFV
ncbi:Uncharacterized protein HZ326_13392 [Fusarium oxysporum f. sp. albedinis]|nr:Uncharacterized protein HZ326_13392 [Fusarium oxysporum f. sp. albedinis]